jgi:hypothetical protein
LAMETQQSIFLESTIGELADLCSELESANITVEAISATDSGDFGVVRMVTSDPRQTSAILRRRQVSFLETQVVTARIPNDPGLVEEASARLARMGVKVHYSYGSSPGAGEDPLVVFRVSSPSRAEEVLRFPDSDG